MEDHSRVANLSVAGIYDDMTTDKAIRETDGEPFLTGILICILSSRDHDDSPMNHTWIEQHISPR